MVGRVVGGGFGVGWEWVEVQGRDEGYRDGEVEGWRGKTTQLINVSNKPATTYCPWKYVCPELSTYLPVITCI